MEVSLPQSEYSDSSRKIGFYRQLFERLQAIPGVETAGLINNLPMGGVNLNGALAIAGRPPDQFGYASFRVAGPGYFQTMNIPLISGRYFTDLDSESGEPAAVISQRLAETTFKGEDPIGKRVLSTNDAYSREEFEHPERWPRIVGVVGDVKHLGLESGTPATVYVCYMQRPRRIADMTVVVRVKGDPASMVAAIRQEAKAIDRNLPVKFEAMERVFSRSTANRRYNFILLGIFAALALVLSVIGIYGVMSYAVSQSTKEIGIRIALGAQRSDVMKLVMGQGTVLAGVGVGLGIAGAFVLTRLMASLLYEVTATDPIVFTVVSLLLVIVALTACYIPARRAIRIDPMVALRCE